MEQDVISTTSAVESAANGAEMKLRVKKSTGDRSFGMTLEQRGQPMATTAFATVSYVFPNSPADRAGIRKGWLVLRINNQSVEGKRVREVALMFKDLMEVDLLVKKMDEQQPNISHVTTATPVNIVSSNAFSAPPVTAHHSMNAAPSCITSGLTPPPATGITAQNAQITTGRGIAAPGTSLNGCVTTRPAETIITNTSISGTKIDTKPFKTGDHIQPNPDATLSRSVEPEQTLVVISNANAVQSHALGQKQSPKRDGIVVNDHAKPISTGIAAASSVTGPTANITSVPVTETVRPTPCAVISEQMTTPEATSNAIKSAPNLTPAQKKPVASPLADPKFPVNPPTSTSPAVKPKTGPPTLSTQSITPSKSIPEATPIAKMQTVSSPPPSTLSTAAKVTSPARTPTSAIQDKKGKKRKRPRSETSTRSTEASGRGGKSRQRRKRADSYHDSNSDLAAEVCVEDYDLDHSCSNQQANRRRYSRRQAGEQKSLTVDRLITMGFTREDAEASVVACGHNPDECMVWIIKNIEERQFIEDLNQASIQSEMTRRVEEDEQKKKETETLQKAKAFTSLFPSSFILSTESTAIKLKKMLESTIGNVSPDCFMRVTLTKLLKLETNAIKWYKEASKCYMLQLAENLENALGSHDVLTCCSQIPSNAATNAACTFVQVLYEAEQTLTKTLFDMPENHGGVPLAFLQADEAMHFDLEEDGFEVLDVAITTDDDT